MAFADRFGAPLAAASGAAVREYDAAVGQLMTFDARVLAQARSALAADRSLVMGHVLIALLYCLGTENSQRPDARAALEAGNAAAAVSARKIRHDCQRNRQLCAGSSSHGTSASG